MMILHASINATHISKGHSRREPKKAMTLSDLIVNVSIVERCPHFGAAPSFSSSSFVVFVLLVVFILRNTLSVSFCTAATLLFRVPFAACVVVVTR